MNPWLLLGGSIGSLIGCAMCDYDHAFPAKAACFSAFVGLTGMSMVPLLHIYAMPVIYDAMIATGVTVGGLSAVAYNAPSEQFLNWGGPLALGLGGLCGVSLLSVLYPGSPALTNIWLYGGLALFSAFLLYDTQKILHRAKTQQRYDPMWESIHVYLDAVNLFVRFA